MSTIFVTGPTGVLGRSTIPALIAAGHQVRALSRSTANDAAIRALGAEPVRGDIFDVDSLTDAMRGADAVLHLATRIPPNSKVRQREAWNENDRLRAEGTRNVVDAAIRNNVSTVVYPSFAFVYPDSGDRWIDAASTPVAPIDILRSTIAAEEEIARFAASSQHGERRGISLRLGGLYGSSLPSTHEQLELAGRGVTPFGGPRNSYTPMLWIDDAATALVAAVERAPSGLYDVVDDEPLTQGELSTSLASAVGRQRLLSPPLWLLRLLAGPVGALLSRSLRISNRRFREAAGWAPTVASAREGLARIAAEHPVPPTVSVPVAVKVGLWAMAIFALLGGIQQQFTPRAFYDTFPGFGMQWVSVDGPYNEHLLRDLGGANLALALVILFVIFRPSVGIVRAVAAATLIAQVPHFIYHATHLGVLATPLDRVLQTATLTIYLLIPIFVLIASREMRAQPATEPDSSASHSRNMLRPAAGLVAGRTS